MRGALGLHRAHALAGESRHGNGIIIHGARITKMKTSPEKHKKTAREEKIQRETQRC